MCDARWKDPEKKNKKLNRNKIMRKNMLNKTLIFFAMFCCTLLGGTISGVILNESDEPLPGANILIQGTSIGATTDIDGRFQIQQLDVGKYDLRIDYIGYYEQHFEFYISKFETDSEELDNQGNIEKLGIDADESEDSILKGANISNVMIKLIPKLLDYDEVIVSASKSQEKVFDAPITVALVSQRKIKEFAGNDIGHALSKVKGVDVYQAGNGRTNINTRGFMAVFNGRFVTLLNGKKFSDPIFRTAYNNTFPTIMEDIERLEVVFGPSSALYGPNAHNGLLNIIPKHPNEKPGLDISYTQGSSNFQSQRLRYAKAGDIFSYKINVENSQYKEWDYDRMYAPKDTDNDNRFLLQGEPFVDENNDGRMDTEDYYDADHNGTFSPGYPIEMNCFLYGCEIDPETDLPTFFLDMFGIAYNLDNLISIERGDALNGVYDEGEDWIERGNGLYDMIEPFTDCGYDSTGNYLCDGDEGWQPEYGDGIHTGPEGIQLFQSDFEKDIYTRKLISSFYYQLNSKTEISLEPSLIQQKNYIPYDMGYLFTTTLYSTISTKLSRPNFSASLNYDYMDGEIITSEELYNAALILFNGDIDRSVDLLSKEPFLKKYNTVSTYGDLSGTIHNINPYTKSLIYGMDFRYDAPRTNRSILRDKGSSQKFVFDGSPLADSTMGEDINILQYGMYAQHSADWSNNIETVFALRFDKHSHYDDPYLSPRIAVKWSGLKNANIRLTYNRAHQVPSLFHLFGHIYQQNVINGPVNLFTGDIMQFGDPNNYDVYGNGTGDLAVPMVLRPYVPLFAGNGYGFTLDDSIHIDPLKIELVDSYELGIKGIPLQNLFFELNLYYSKFKNMISTTQYMQTIFTHDPPYRSNQLTHIGDEETDKRDILFTYVNLDEIEYLGFDISLEYQLNNKTALSSSYSYYNTFDLIEKQKETSYIGNDWAWAEYLTGSRGMSSYDIMHFNAPIEKFTFGVSVSDLFFRGLYFELSGKYNSQFNFESGGWIYSEDEQNLSYLYTGCGCEGFANKFFDTRPPLGGNTIYDLKLNYDISQNLKIKMSINNLTDKDDVRLVGSPKSRRYGLLELNYHL